MSKDVVKAVLASPLTVPWPNIPKHLQTTVMHALPRLIPSEVADYHVSRARRHTSKRALERKERRAEKRKADGESADQGVTTNDENNLNPTNTSLDAESTKKPPVLEHIVLGINEVIKSLEHSIEELKIRLLVMSDALNAQGVPKAISKPNHLFPTAPRSPSPTPSENSQNVQLPAAQSLTTVLSSLVFIVIPLLSINPQSLVSPIPQYAATHNSLVYQHDQLAKHVQNRLPKDKWEDVIGGHREEVRVVPLGNVEKEMAGLVGLRRLACMGFKTSHPAVKTLHTLLPKSMLHPPRHNMTLPYPTSALKIYTGDDRAAQPPAAAPVSLPLPTIHYAPLTIKGIQTTAPLDNTARKKRRLEEVRAKRVEVKKRKKDERMGLVKKAASRRKEQLWKGREGSKPKKGEHRPEAAAQQRQTVDT
ncbi:hypothetical protein BCR39DRAFT_564439 [Naematelia encephala]|uniref:Uncharacterized protein n=1 Tax=Naematelia encephala TaxID=71784 RepID=A0A1Y2BBV9_9TREE|nr:hypothetical protein BCR39DRAFT_564439 [Naematelia encephala]